MNAFTEYRLFAVDTHEFRSSKIFEKKKEVWCSAFDLVSFGLTLSRRKYGDLP